MKKRSYHIIIILTLITVMIGSSLHVANAEAGSWWSLVTNPGDTLTYILTFIVNTILQIASWFVVLSAMLLDVSLTITLHIKDFVDSTPAIFDIWKAIRDISGLFIIFALLYAAIRLILGLKQDSFGTLIKNIVIAGILINFSFFITSVAIDASNMVSLAIYNAIVPTQTTPSGSTGGIISDSMSNAKGISTILMNSLSIQKNFDPKIMKSAGAIISNDTSKSATDVRIILIGITGIIIMISVSASFVFASLAFIIRLVILLFLLAFSPIWFAAQIMPKMAGDYAKQWTSLLTNQLVFMPVYLLLMYASLSILNKSKIFNTGADGALWTGATATGVPTEYLTFAINSAFIIIMLNLPLLAALKLGAGAGVLDKFGEKIGAKNMWKWAGGQAGSRTLGRVAYAVNNSDSMRKTIGKSPLLGGIASKGLSKVSSSGFGQKGGGYEDRLKSDKKYYEDTYKRVGTVNRADYKTDAEFKDAEKRAKGYQENYRNKISGNGILGSVFSSRAGRDFGRTKSHDEAEKKRKKDLKKQESAVIQKSKTAKEELEKLESKIKADSTGIGFGAPKGADPADIARVAALKAEIKNHEDTLQEIKNNDESDRTKEIAKEVASQSRSMGGNEAPKPKEEAPK